MSRINGKKLRARYDYIVIGAGAAGSVVAARLSEARSVTILLVEAGPSDFSPFVRMPAAQSYPIVNPNRTWVYQTGPEPYLDGRTITHARGRMLGGSSSLNGMVFVRGNPRDYDGWADQGLTDWSYARCLPYFRRLEKYDGGADIYRGGDGPVAVTTLRGNHPLYQTFLRAGEQAGYQLNPDYNGFRQEGVFLFQANIDNGVRASTGRVYMQTAIGRTNLQLLLNAVARKLNFAGTRAVGVEIEQGGMIYNVEAEREIILCGGAFNSPHLLLLSGVGDAAQLREHDISVVRHVPGVGQNLEDHPVASVRYAARRPGISPVSRMNVVRSGLIGLNWLLFRSGIGASNLWETGAFLKSSEAGDRPDIQHEFLPMLAELNKGAVRVADGFRYQAALLRPYSKGSLRLTSANPRSHPSIVMNYLSDIRDQRVMIDGMRRTDEMANQAIWDKYRGEAVSPRIRKMSDPDILAWLRTAVGTQYHPCATCRMGSDEFSVVDQTGRVHGLEGIRVVDASIFPSSISGNPHCPTIMVAEKLSDSIKGNPPLSPIHAAYA